MALYLVYPGLHAFGDFDLLDTDQSSVYGGEVMVLDTASTTISSTEKFVYDVTDGYVADSGAVVGSRVIARIADETTESLKPFYLSDDGTTHYGTLFGSVIGSPAGRSTTGTNLGPHTCSGSGKVTLWGTAGIYAVSTDAVETALSDLVDTPLPGELLYRSTNGKLTSLADTGDKIAMYIEHTTNGSLVTTPASLVGSTVTYDRIKFHYLGAGHNA